MSPVLWGERRALSSRPGGILTFGVIFSLISPTNGLQQLLIDANLGHGWSYQVDIGSQYGLVTDSGRVFVNDWREQFCGNNTSDNIHVNAHHRQSSSSVFLAYMTDWSLCQLIPPVTLFPRSITVNLRINTHSACLPPGVLTHLTSVIPSWYCVRSVHLNQTEFSIDQNYALIAQNEMCIAPTLFNPSLAKYGVNSMLRHAKTSSTFDLSGFITIDPIRCHRYNGKSEVIAPSKLLIRLHLTSSLRHFNHKYRVRRQSDIEFPERLYIKNIPEEESAGYEVCSINFILEIFGFSKIYQVYLILKSKLTD